MFQNETNLTNTKANKKTKKKINYSGILIFIEHKNNVTELVQAKIKDFATHEKPIILYDSNNKQRKTSTLGHKEIKFSENEIYV